MDKKIDEHFTLTKIFFTALFTMISGLYYYLLKERSTIKTEIKTELSEDIDRIARKLENKKVDKTILKKLFKVVENLAKKDEEARLILETQNLQLT